MEMDIRGIPEVKRALAIDSARVEGAIKRAMGDLMNEVFTKADQLVPVDEGNLRTSGHILTSQGPNGESTITIAYGGAAAPYAAVQHERLDYWHPPKPPGKSKVGKRQGTGPGADPSTGRGAKYLERPFLEVTGNLKQKLIRLIRAEFHGGGL